MSCLSREKFKTFVTEQKMLFFTQIMILLGLFVQVIIFAALLVWGRPPSNNIPLVLEFFAVVALWVITIDIGVVLFWWVSERGDWPIDLSDYSDMFDEAVE